MKKMMMALAVAAMITACEKPVIPTEDDERAKVTFSLQGDFTLNTTPFTRSLQADDKDMTDVWVIDYIDGDLVQTVHQSDNTASDFGTPTVPLAFGTHTLYFVASRGKTPTLDTTEETLTFGTPSDTFWKAVTLTVSDNTPVTRTVSLDRIVTRMKVILSDAMPAEVAAVSLTPAEWYAGFNYTDGSPASLTEEDEHIMTIPSNYAGRTNLSFSTFGFSAATEWTADVTVKAYDGDDDIITSITISNAPFLRNRSSDYTGSLFTSNGVMTLSLNEEWIDSYEGTW